MWILKALKGFPKTQNLPKKKISSTVLIPVSQDSAAQPQLTTEKWVFKGRDFQTWPR
jgi:hypothetical protein